MQERRWEGKAGDQSAFPGPGVGQDSWNPVGQYRVCKGSIPFHGEHAKEEGGLGRKVSPPAGLLGSVPAFTKHLKTCMCLWLCKKLDLSASLEDK